MGMLGTFVVTAYLKFNSMQALEKDRALVSSILNQARSLTLSSKGNSQYGVRFNAGEIVLFTGASYSAATTTNLSFPLSPQVSLSTSLSGGGVEVVFERLSGKTRESGTVTLALVSNASSTKSITIYGTGVIQNN